MVASPLLFGNVPPNPVANIVLAPLSKFGNLACVRGFSWTDLELLRQALSHRLARLFLIGPAVVCLLLYLLARLVPDEMPHYSPLRFVAFYAVLVAWVVWMSYQRARQKWTLERWARRSLWMGAIHAAFLAYACAPLGKYWPGGVIVYLSAILAYIGYVTLSQTLFFVTFFAGVFFLAQAVEFPDLLRRDLVFNVSVFFGCGVMMVWIGLASRYDRDQDGTIRGLLRESRRNKRTITEERKKSDRLLLSILPASVAEELKDTGRNRPVHYDQASVLFTDFQGFTRIAEGLAPEALVAELDKCFSYFDSLMDRYKLEKLKTIGDSYMCAGGVPEPNGTHAVDCILAALEIQAFMNQMKSIKAQQGLDYWELRLGIHTGPLVAGVIGEKKFAYDVWSDTVNTASRCESAGVAGKINISGTTYSVVKDFFVCEYRGKIEIKNKAAVDMYFVDGILPELSRDGKGRVPGTPFQRLYDRLDTT